MSSIEQYDYDLPPQQIAQEPCSPRDQSRLLVVRRADGQRRHMRFYQLPELLQPGDLLVLNNTRVMPARLVGTRARTGGKWEGLFVQAHADGVWELLCQTRGRLIVGETLLVDSASAPAALRLCLVSKTPDGRWLARPDDPAPVAEVLARVGRIPLPPYIRKGRAGPEDSQRYQTVYASRTGAVAAPTAGLHFTEAVFAELAQRQIAWAFVTLHVGPGTFQPVQVEDVASHRMQPEWAELPAETAEAIAACWQRGGRVVAVGTTSVRVLESVAATGDIRPWSGLADVTIAPPYTFHGVDALLTNFHLPRSSLLLLVAAFMGLEPMHAAYREAIAQGYRFYSYGDAMLIL
jgi:S-adenosylmethionine:tRNA ribosyltransferase-isomerase